MLNFGLLNIDLKFSDVNLCSFDDINGFEVINPL